MINKNKIQEIDKRNDHAYAIVFREEQHSHDIAAYLAETIRMSVAEGYDDGKLTAMIIMSANAAGMGDYEESFELLEDISQEAIDASTDFNRMIYYSGYMIYYVEHKGNEAMAIEYSKLELASAEAHGDMQEIMRVKMNIASISADMGFYDTALDMYMKIIEYNKSINDVHMLAYCYINLASIYAATQQDEQAKSTYLQCLSCAEEKNLVDLIHGAHFELAKLYANEKAYDTAIQYLNKSKVYEAQLGKAHEIFDRVHQEVAIQIKRKHFEEAYEAILEVEDQLASLENTQYIMGYHKDKAEVCAALGRYDSAYKALNIYIELYEKNDRQNLDKEVSRMIHEEYNKELVRLDALTVIGRELTILTDIDEMLQRLKDEFDLLMDEDTIGIGLLRNGALHFDHYFHNGVKIRPQTTSVESRVSLAAWCIRHSRPLVLNDLQREYTNYVDRVGTLDQGEEKPICSAMFRPLTVGDQVIGIFTVQSHKANAYSSVEAKIHQIISDYLAIAVNNAQQRNILEKLSSLDNLTELSNRRGFTDFFDRCVIGSIDLITSATIMMCDLDHFKKINDTFGHIVGDEALKKVADSLKDMENDRLLAARLGGEEFGIIALNLTKDEAKSLAEDIRANIESLVLEVEGKTVRFTTSIGMVHRKSHEELNYSQLYFEADKALYHAKDAGRNRVYDYDADDCM